MCRQYSWYSHTDVGYSNIPEYLLNITKYLGVRFTILHFCLLVFYFTLRQGFSLWFWLFWNLDICRPGWPASQSTGIKGVQQHVALLDILKKALCSQDVNKGMACNWCIS